MRKTERLRLELTDWGYQGECVGRIEGMVVFAAHGLPGEEVVVEADERRSRFVRGRVVEVLRPSPDRVAPPCPLFGSCGGCSWQHAHYEAQLRLKREVAVSQLRRIGGFTQPPVLPMVGAAHPWSYRNQARFAIDRAGRLCFVRRRSHDLLRVDTCDIAQPAVNAALSALRGHVKGLRQVVIRHGNRSGDLVVSPRIEAATLPTGQTSYREELLGRRYRVSADSFFQSNTRVDRRDLADVPGLSGGTDAEQAGEYSQADLLVLAVLDRLGAGKDDVVLDAYCGVGAFALPIAKQARRVIGIEEARCAVEDAEHNLRLGEPALENVVLRRGKVEDLLPKIDERIDLVVLDPPRTGCATEVLSALAAARPRRIIYVSCDLATLARDSKVLCESVYDLAEVLPIDMFPQTHHVECVATLVRRG